jgi:hypothetical protein
MFFEEKFTGEGFESRIWSNEDSVFVSNGVKDEVFSSKDITVGEDEVVIVEDVFG